MKGFTKSKVFRLAALLSLVLYAAVALVCEPQEGCFTLPVLLFKLSGIPAVLLATRLAGRWGGCFRLMD